MDTHKDEAWEKTRRSIRARLKARGTTVGVMADEMRVPRSSLWNYLRPKNPQTPSAFGKFAMTAWAVGFRPYAPYLKRAKRKKTAKGVAASLQNLEKAAAASGAPDNGACADCGAPMVERSGPSGPFLGCSRFPDCRCTRVAGEGRQDPNKRVVSADDFVDETPDPDVEWRDSK